MKFLSLVYLLIPAFSWSLTIPLEKFDQSKLEQLLRNIPSSLTRSEPLEGFTRKHFVFPAKNSDQHFNIVCSSDFYKDATIPSDKRCSLDVSDQLVTSADVIKFKLTDQKVVDQLFSAISYGQDEKKFYSNERFKAVALDGNFATAFRYMFICKKDNCDILISPKGTL